MIRFGPSGNSDKFFEDGLKESVQAPKWLNDMGLTSYEYPLTLGRFLSEKTAKAIGEEAKKYNIEVSVHAPYFINFCNPTKESQESNAKYLLTTLNNLRNLGGNRCIFHSGTQMKMTREEALSNLKNNFLNFLPKFYDAGFDDMWLMPETMGKYSQVGNVDEIIEMASWDKSVVPCFDFGHINCIMQGALKSKQDFLDIFNKSIDKLGFEKTNNCHIHFSKIKYSDKGEVSHLTFEDTDFGPNFEPMIDAIVQLGINPNIICESRGTQAVDAKKILEYFLSLH